MQQQDPFGPGGPFGGGEPGPAEMLVGLACYGTLFLISIAVLVLISYLLYRAASALPEPYRQVTPGTAFLLVIPLFNIIWLFIYLPRLSRSYQAFFASRGDTRFGDCSESVGLWAAICSALSLIPCVNVVTGIAYLVLIIIYLVRMSEYRNAALAGPAAPPMQPPVAP